MDSEERFKQHCANPQKFQKLKELGWIDKQFDYRFNQQGFRSIEFDSVKSAGMAFGCSYTEGVGLPIENVWPSIVSKNLDYPIWNLGVGGSSMDTVFRLAEYWIPALKPKFVLIAGPLDSRIEICNADGEFVTYIPSDKIPRFYKEWIMNSINGQLNFKKNLLAITEICNRYNIPVIALEVENNLDTDNSSRDLSHSGTKIHMEYANKILEKLKGII
jgi:hypothetical protein